MDYLDTCGWKNCKQSSTTLYYNFVGLCDKHSEEWFNKKEAFLGVKKIIPILLKLCSPFIREQYKEKLNELRLK